MLEDIGARPYFIRAVYDWCVDKGNTPYVIANWRETQYPGVPVHLVSEQQRIVFNLSSEAVRNLIINEEGVFFTARFIGKTIEINIPLSDILTIYGMEVGKGISFPVVENMDEYDEQESAEAIAPNGAAKIKKKKSPSLRLV